MKFFGNSAEDAGIPPDKYIATISMVCASVSVFAYALSNCVRRNLVATRLPVKRIKFDNVVGRWPIKVEETRSKFGDVFH